MKRIPVFLFAIIAFANFTCNENDSTVKEKSDSPKIAPTVKAMPDLPLQISFQSLDGLVISGYSYFKSDSLPWILLCHQAGYSKGEYKETAPKFEALGFNCLAIDQRSGNEVNGIKNETAEHAKEQGKPTGYLDAEQDIRAAINYLFEQTKKPVIVVGSSYSAGLVLKIATGNPLVKAVLAFSPGEYYGDKLHLAESIKALDKPVFITSAKSESKDAKVIFDAIASKQKTFFEPTSPGVHASSCLWESTNDYKEYWVAVTAFLKSVK
ncbi:MAG TPA: dienelactone hydrolase family protein [Bacteroidia bacterium]|nr:dienelactone hydrolase family protein [Bacteroidia bacterium]